MKVFDLFYLMKGTSRSIVRRNPQPHPYVQMVLRGLVSDYTLKVNNTENFQMSSKSELETRILNNALAVCCLLNQRTQIAQIVIHGKEYICNYGPELGSYCSPSNSDEGLVENVAANIQGKKRFAKFRMLQIEQGKHVYHIYTFVTLMFRTEVILICRLRIR